MDHFHLDIRVRQACEEDRERVVGHIRDEADLPAAVRNHDSGDIVADFAESCLLVDVDHTEPVELDVLDRLVPDYSHSPPGDPFLRDAQAGNREPGCMDCWC